MKKIISICATIFVVVGCFAQGNETIDQKLGKYESVSYQDTDGGWYSVKQKGKEGVCDLNGNEVIPPIWEEIMYYQMIKDGYCEVKRDGKWGVLSKKIKLVIPCNYDGISSHQLRDRQICEVKNNGKNGVYDINKQKEIIPCSYDEIYSFQLCEGQICIVKSNGKKGVYDINQQKEFIPCSYDEISSHQLRDGQICEIENNGKKGVYDIDQQKEIIPCSYDEIYFYDIEENGLCRVIINHKYGIINKNGKEIISPNKYGYIEFSNKKDQPMVAFVQMGALIKSGYLDEAYHWHDNEYKNKGKCGVVDLSTGQEIIPCKYDDIKVSDENLYTFNVGGEKPTIIKGDPTAKGGKWGVIDSSNRVIIPAEYDIPVIFKDGVAQVSKNGTVSLLPHPYKGSSLTFANGITNNDVDGEIPHTNKNNKETFAFVLANENYTNYSGADFSINDGKIFAEYCKKTLGLPEHNVRYFEDATYGNFVSAIKKIEDIASVYEGEATIIVYYSGLGTIDVQTKQRYILPSDAAPGSLEKTGYSVQKLIEQLNALKTKGTYVLLDAPFTGTDKNGKVLAENRGIRIAPKQLASSGSVLVCFSNSDNENSYASSKYGHGLFTYGILKKLKDSKGNCSWKELLDCSSEWVKKESLLQYDKMQTPKYILQESNNSIINKTF